MKFLVIGAGFSGAALARELADRLDCAVEVRDERGHVAGNCHTERDPRTGVMLHCYFENIFEVPYMVAYFWGLAAVASCLPSLKKKEERKPAIVTDGI